MTVHNGEGLPGNPELDAILHIPEPTIELREPKIAPPSMLEQVRVNTENRCLEASTPLGIVAVEIYWTMDPNAETSDTRGDFFSALDSTLDPQAGTNPVATQKYPYAVLPDGALYEVAARVPLEAVDTEWSERRCRDIGGARTFFGGIPLAEFRRAYPNIEVDLPEGNYTITASERTKPVLAIAARVENGEPLSRMQTIMGDATHYRETLTGDFMRSELRPDTAISLINSRTTIREGGEADRQRLVFKAHDGFQRTGDQAEENSGLLELIVMQGEAVEQEEFTFTPHVSLISPTDIWFDKRRNDGQVMGSRFGGEPARGGGLTGGETRYRPPETVHVAMSGVRSLRAIAAFRFAMAAERKAANGE